MKKVNLEINDWCKFCGICAAFCSVKALDFENGEKPVFLKDKCSGCKLCVLRCPDFAIKVEADE